MALEYERRAEMRLSRASRYADNESLIFWDFAVKHAVLQRGAVTNQFSYVFAARAPSNMCILSVSHNAKRDEGFSFAVVRLKKK